jgi:hypothetical protein
MDAASMSFHNKLGLSLHDQWTSGRPSYAWHWNGPNWRRCCFTEKKWLGRIVLSFASNYSGQFESVWRRTIFTDSITEMMISPRL